MRNNRSARFIVVCEDKQHAVFARRFLKLSNINRYHIRIEPCPPGTQDAKQWIRNNLPKELEGFRNYNAKNRSTERVLFVMADADNATVEERIADIASQCDPKPGTSDNVCFIIPRWAVETWIKYFREGSADESDRIRPQHKLSMPEDCWPQVQKLKDMCDSDSLSPDAPGSLRIACQQFQQIRSALHS